MTLSQLLSEGVERSGITGIIGDINNLSERITTHSLNTVLGIKDSKKVYRTRDPLVEMLGPSATTLNTLIKTMPGFFDGNISKREARVLKSIIPGNNLFYLDWLFSKVTDALVTKKKNRSKGRKR